MRHLNVTKAGKNEKAFWRSQSKRSKVWERESKDHQRLMSLQRGHAAGWIDGVAWARRQARIL